VGHPAQPPAQAGSPRAGCTAPRPGGARISPEKETPQPPWAAWVRAPSPSEGRSSSSCSDRTSYQIHTWHGPKNKMSGLCAGTGALALLPGCQTQTAPGTDTQQQLRQSHNTRDCEAAPHREMEGAEGLPEAVPAPSLEPVSPLEDR